MGVKQQVATFWLDRDFISAEVKIHQHHRHRKVSRSSIEEFQTQYITAIELASQLNTAPRKIVNLLRDRNIPPVTGKSVDGGRQYLFIRKKERLFSQRTLKKP